VILMFENKNYDQVIGQAPYITGLANKCATSTNWKYADTKVDGSTDGHYNSKPNHATLTNGVSPSVQGLTDDTCSATTGVDNIYNQLNLAGKSFKDYCDARAGGCGVKFSGDYHDAIRYYTNVASICDAHDIPLSTFMDDVNSGNLPAFSMSLPTNHHNMHYNNVTSGDAYAQSQKRIQKATWRSSFCGMRIAPFRMFYSRLLLWQVLRSLLRAGIPSRTSLVCGRGKRC